jgi:hypothetical protein
MHRDSVADQEAVRLSQFCAKMLLVKRIVVKNGSKRPPTMVVRVDLISGTFNLVLQDLALRKSTWSEVRAGKRTDKVNLAVAKPMPIPICLKLTTGKGFLASIFSRDWNFYSNFEITRQVATIIKEHPSQKKLRQIIANSDFVAYF